MSSINPGLLESITTLLREKGSRVLGVSGICERLELIASTAVSQEEVAEAIDHLETEGRIVAVRGKRFSLLEFTSSLSGRIRVHTDGSGVVRTIFALEPPEIRIDRKSMSGAMNGDLVLVRVDKKNVSRRRGGRAMPPAGEVMRILQRAHRTIVGRFHAEQRPFVRPLDTRLDRVIFVDSDETAGARDGEMVHVEISRYADRVSEAHGRILEPLGMLGEPGVDIEIVIRQFDLTWRFPDHVLQAAESIEGTISENEIAKREDLRDRTIITIDGETAKDFDDAIDVTHLPNGRWRLGVHIADVSHYVHDGDPLDREAFERATSVYFPGRAIPMLPERLSNGICSLNPRVDRLTFSVEVEIDAKGNMSNRRFFRSVISTRERMTYTDVNALLTTDDPALRERYAAILDDLARMHDLYEILRRRREARGSIDFDFPEADVQLGEAGEIETIMPSDRNIAHRLIEEYMLVANETVAQHLVLSGQPGLYRVHQQPDPQKLEDLRLLLIELGHALRGDTEEIHPGELQRVLRTIAGTPEERFLSELVLRSMKRASYSAESTGHFALALQHYSHFTSPIRRYPDLVTHRMLGHLLEHGPMRGEELAEKTRRMPEVALQSSDRERRAEEAERAVLEWKKVIFMRDKIGTEFAGRITGTMPFGLFIELDEFFVQGLVPIASVGGDYWLFIEKAHRLRGADSGREFRLGDRVVVEVESIDEERRQIAFRLIAAGGAPVEPRSTRRLRR